MAIPLKQIIGVFEEMEKPFETIIRAGASVVKEITTVAGESLINTGKGLDMKASLIGFQEGKAKTPELMQKEAEEEQAEIREGRRKKMIYDSLPDALRNPQEYAQIPGLEQATLEFLGLGGDEKKKLLHLSSGLDEKHLNHAYHISAGRKALLDAKNEQEQQTDSLEVAQQTKGASAMNAMMEGAAGSQGGGQANLSAQAVG